MNALTNAIDSLDFMPERYRVYDEVVRFGQLRTFTIDKYRILYHVDNDRMLVTIFRIVYAHASNDNLLK